MTRKLKITRIVLSVLVVAFAVLAVMISHDSPCTSATAAPAGAPRMKATMYRCYGTAEVLKLEDVEKPVPAADELLVKVRAAAVNPLDFHYLHGTPYIMRMSAGLGAPKDPHMGI